jgi:sec-independent protein translocase protein TatA
VLAGLFQPAHLLVLLLIVLMIMGPGRLRNMGRLLGQSVRELVAGFRESAETPAAPAAPAASAPPELPARPCPRCAAWSVEMANYCTRCGARLD